MTNMTYADYNKTVIDHIVRSIRHVCERRLGMCDYTDIITEEFEMPDLDCEDAVCTQKYDPNCSSSCGDCYNKKRKKITENEESNTCVVCGACTKSCVIDRKLIKYCPYCE